MEPNLITDWIEQHPHTVSLAKWAVLLLVAWIIGLFRLLRRLSRKPSAGILCPVSRCYIQPLPEFEGHTDVVRAAYFIDASVVNPTNEKVVIEQFTLSYLRKKKYFGRSLSLHPISCPSRPRQNMGENTKFQKVFFTNFPDGLNDMTVSDIVEAKCHESGYLLFVSFTFGDWNPRIVNGYAKVYLTVRLTTGEKLKTKGWIQVSDNLEKFESWLPGIREHLEQECTWNAYVQK